MNTQIRYYHPEPTEATGAGLSADEHAIDQPQDSASADRAISSSTDAGAQTSDEDDTILGLGPNRSAGGLSGDGERTDEYDAAVMGIGD